MNPGFEWDTAKASANLRKHRVSFELALRVFADPLAFSHQDRIEGGEQRWQTLGMADGVLLLLVAHTVLNHDDGKRSALFLHEWQRERSDATMRKKTVKTTFNLTNPPPLNEQQRAEVAALQAMPGSGVDTSDIAELTPAFWQNAARNPFYKPTKTVTTVRVDSDVLLWLKSQGKGYQTRLNVILREAMLKEVSKV